MIKSYDFNCVYFFRPMFQNADSGTRNEEELVHTDSGTGNEEELVHTDSGTGNTEELENSGTSKRYQWSLGSFPRISHQQCPKWKTQSSNS